MSKPDYDIRLAVTEEDYQSIYRLRYGIYVEQMHRPQADADHARRVVIDKLDRFGHLFGAWARHECVGTVRTNWLREGDIGDYRAMYALERLTAFEEYATSITTRLMILPRYRQSRLAVQLAQAIYDRGIRSHITGDYIDCNPHLVPFFARLGYVPHRTDLVHPEYGHVTVMKLRPLDEEHLADVRSPFLKSLRGRRAA